MATVRKHPSQMTVEELKERISEIDEELQGAGSSQRQKLEDELDDLQAVLKQRKKEQQNADVFGRSLSPKEQLVASLIAAEDSGDDLEAAIIRAKLRQASASNVDSRMAAAIGRSNEIIKTSNADVKDKQKAIARLQTDIRDNADTISRLQGQNTKLNQQIIVLERELSELKKPSKE